MKRILFLPIFIILFSFCAQAEETPVAPYLPAQENKTSAEAPITVQFPYEKMAVSRGAKNIFLFGKINLPGKVSLDINGVSVPVHPNGAFLAFLPVENGENAFLLTATNGQETARALRHVRVPGVKWKDLSGRAAFDPDELFPQASTELLPGDTVGLYARATPGAEVTATLSGLKNGKNIPLQEVSFMPGLYRAKFTISPDQKPKTAKIVYHLKNGPQNTKAKITASKKLKVRSFKEPFTYAQVKTPGVKLRKIPTEKENLFPFYRAYGEVRVTGRMNNQYRLFLNKEESAWLEEDKLKTISAWPGLNRLSGLDMTTDAEKTRLRFGGRRPVVVQIHEFTDRMEVAFYYTENFDENFNFDGTGLLVEQVVWSQPQRNTVLFKIYFKKGVQPWGHSYDFEGNDFVLDIIHRPKITPTKNKPLKGARILIDAGHSPRRTIPYDGAIGPTGYMEYEANLALAEDLKPLLEKHGATVLMTREGKNRKSLQERYKMALQEKAHLFVSLHYNALPETINPLSKPRGYSIYYNYPHSFELAKAVYESFTRLVSIPDNGLIANDVLFIPRIPQMPSILVENAYLILPEQEEMAKTREGRAPFVRAVYEGILKFYGVTPEPVLTENRKRKTRKKPARKTYLRPAKGK